MDKIFEITAKEVTVQVKDERTGVVYSRTLPIDYYENANVLKLSGKFFKEIALNRAVFLIK